MRVADLPTSPFPDRIITAELQKPRLDWKPASRTVLYTNAVNRNASRSRPRESEHARFSGLADSTSDSKQSNGWNVRESSSCDHTFIDKFSAVVQETSLDVQERRTMLHRASPSSSRKHSCPGTAWDQTRAHDRQPIWEKLATPRPILVDTVVGSVSSHLTGSKYAPTARMLELAAAEAREQRLYELQKDQLTFQPNINSQGGLAATKSRYMSASRLQRERSSTNSLPRNETPTRTRKPTGASAVKHLARGIRDYEKEKQENEWKETRECTFQPNLGGGSRSRPPSKARPVTERLYAEAKLRHQREQGVPVVQKDGAWVYAAPKVLPTIVMEKPKPKPSSLDTNEVISPYGGRKDAAPSLTYAERKTVQLGDDATTHERVRIVPMKKTKRPLKTFLETATYSTEPEVLSIRTSKNVSPVTSPVLNTEQQSDNLSVTGTTDMNARQVLTDNTESVVDIVSSTNVTRVLSNDEQDHTVPSMLPAEKFPSSINPMVTDSDASCFTDEDEDITFRVVGD